jgi:hypothetical protein
MAVRGILYTRPVYSLPCVGGAKTNKGRGVTSREEANQMSGWLHPKGSLVPLCMDGRVSLVTLDWVSPRPP